MTKIVTSSNHLSWGTYHICMGAQVEDLDKTPWLIGTSVAFLWAIVVVMITYRTMKRRWLSFNEIT